MYGIGLQLTSTTIIGGSYSPASLFTANEPGVWYDPSDLTTLYQDTAGTTPVTTPGQPVGLALDKSRGLALGPELVTNGAVGLVGTATAATFNTFTGQGSVSRVDVSNQSFVRWGSLVSGGTYRIVISCQTNGILVRAGSEADTSQFSVLAGQSATIFVAASVATPRITVTNLPSAGTSTFTVTSFRELAGNHATQPIAASRPIYGIMPSVGVRNRANGSADVGNNTYWPAAQTVNGVTMTKVASGFDIDGLPYADFTVVGTASADSFIPPYATALSRITAAPSQQYTGSFLCRVISGSAPPAGSGLRVEIVGETAPSTNTETGVGSLFNGTTETLVSHSYTLVNGATNQTRVRIQTVTLLGVTVNYTVRIKALQFELGASRTNYQFNYSQFNVVEAPFASLGYLSFDGVDDFMVTPAVNFASYTWDGQARRNLALGSAQPANEAFWPASLTQSGITATKVASGFRLDGLPYVRMRYQGTSTAQFVDQTYTAANSKSPAVAGQAFTTAVGVKIVSGTVPTNGRTQIYITERDAGGVLLVQSFADITPTSEDAVITHTRTITGATTATAETALNLAFATGVAVDITLEWYGLQIEQGTARTAWQGTGTDEVTVVAGVQKLSDAARGTLVELTTGTAGRFSVNAPVSAGANYEFGSVGTVGVGAFVAGFAAPDSAILSGQGKISTDTAILRRNGTQVASVATDQGTGNYANAIVYIGRRGGTTLPFNGNLYSLIVRGKSTNATGLTATETWVAGKTGVTL